MSEKCVMCDSKKKMSEARVTINYTAAGLSNVTLKNIPQYKCADCGEVYTEIPNVISLHQMIAEALVRHQPAPLKGEHIKFIRQYLGHSTEDYASLLGIDKKTLSRIENEKQKHGDTLDNMIRWHVLTKSPDRLYEEVVSSLTSGTRKALKRFVINNNHGKYAFSSPIPN